jgi:hypothetical protein
VGATSGETSLADDILPLRLRGIATLHDTPSNACPCPYEGVLRASKGLGDGVALAVLDDDDGGGDDADLLDDRNGLCPLHVWDETSPLLGYNVASHPRAAAEAPKDVSTSKIFVLLHVFSSGKAFPSPLTETVGIACDSEANGNNYPCHPRPGLDC